MTSAWNASLQGHKLWVVFPPHLPKSIVKGKEFQPKDEDNEAINYFAKILPKIVEKEGVENL
jgi:histone arginine demethylase JMJD6